eukprot:CAMPEP_0175483270 /NCGR_PEP_ID=MMETSP0095-20121207/79401_1 /TAXON_ID=311494 /ORGANISM="Alexandrium monilatum, Strain CCMP3105" /LENGTH=132 /DNA_ID=CAMNT_0016784973 /DNA_START=335 /DNA_END=732 /DNA_ORIENTATION=+
MVDVGFSLPAFCISAGGVVDQEGRASALFLPRPALEELPTAPCAGHLRGQNCSVLLAEGVVSVQDRLAVTLRHDDEAHPRDGVTAAWNLAKRRVVVLPAPVQISLEHLRLIRLRAKALEDREGLQELVENLR